MPLLKNGNFTEDRWIRPEAADPIPETGDVLVTYARLLSDWQALSSRPGKLGVVFASIERAEALTLFLPRLSLIVLPFPAFSDGRAYSLARQIRNLGFAGELRASGNVLPDQLQFMIGVGFDAFEVTPRFPEAVWQRAAASMTLSYQHGQKAARSVWEARHREAAPWFEQPHAG
jgi:uncharacterized protein (DUF934 family)